jgi:NAD(P)-dependent dehydrogenase (short-subunit alcohol dehydrogenase family)
VAKTITAFLPLIKKGSIKKVITLSTGFADLDATNAFALTLSPAYAASKGALNILIAKYNASYGSQGILFLSISPGIVNTDEGPPKTPEELAAMMAAMGPFLATVQKNFPTFTGPISTEESVTKMLQVVNGASLENGDGGAFISHHGNKTWV